MQGVGVQEDDAIGVQAGDVLEQRLGLVKDGLAGLHVLHHQVGDAAQVDQGALVPGELHILQPLGQRHLRPGGPGGQIGVHGDDVVAAAGLDAHVGGRAQLLGRQQAKGPGGVAAELAAHHLHAPVAPLLGGADKAHLLSFIFRHGHQLGGDVRPAALLHGVQHKQGDVARRVGAQYVQLHNDTRSFFF